MLTKKMHLWLREQYLYKSKEKYILKVNRTVVMADSSNSYLTFKSCDNFSILAFPTENKLKK